MSCVVTFYDNSLRQVAAYTVADDGSTVTTLSPERLNSAVGFSVKVKPATGNDMVKARMDVLERQFRRFIQDLSDAVDNWKSDD